MKDQSWEQFLREHPEVTTDELAAAIEQNIESLRADIDAHDERLAIQRAHIDTSPAATNQRALQALQEPDRTWGKHAVARAWLRAEEPHSRIFRKEPA